MAPTYHEFKRRVALLEREVRRQKKLKEALRESEDIYKTISERSMAGIYVVLEGKFHAVNANAASYAGYSPEELIGRKSDSIVHPQDRAQVKLNARAMLCGERSSPHEFRIITKQNNIRWIMETVTSISFKGKPAILGNSMDITERKEAEVKLKESENLYRAIFETTRSATMILEEDMTISLINTEFEKLTGYRREDWEGKRKWTEFVVKQDLPKMKKYHRLRRIDPGLAPRNYEFSLIDSGGRVKNVFLTVDMIPGTKKSVASLMDITARKVAEEKLKESENLYRAIFETTGTATIIIEEDMLISLINTEFEKMTGYRREDWEGKRKWTEFVVREDLARMTGYHRLRRVDPGAPPRNYEFGLIDSRGRIRNIMATVDMIPATKKSVASLMDITERKEAEEKLKESENLYRAIFETTGSATIIIEEDMTISLLNTVFEKLSGYRREEWEGKKKWTEFVVKQDLGRMRKYHRLRRIDPNSAPKNYEFRLIDSKGQIRDVYLTVDMIPGTKKSVASFMDVTGRKRAEEGLRKREKELKIKSRNLLELNTALRVLLKQREDDKMELEEKVLSNIKEFVLPYIEKIKESRMDPKSMAYVSILESNLRDIISPFSRKLSSKYINLTPKEIQIANFIKDGKTSKEIADILNVSRSAIDIHRYRIRNKLGLNNKRANLRSHLSNL